MSRFKTLAAAAALALAGLSAAPARGDAVDRIGKQLVELESDVANLSQGIQRPSAVGPRQEQERDLASRRLIDAQVNFGIGNYADASIILYDFVEKNPRHPAWDEGLYYLAESLFQKGDFVASRTYFTELAERVGPRSKFYQQALERLVELTIELDDATEVDRWLSALDGVPAAKLRASVPYVRGKYAYFQERYDDAIGWFQKVPRGSAYYLQSGYFVGTARVAKGDLGRAADAFLRVTRQDARSRGERRVVELAHMALGRLYYERDQPSKAVDEYLEISRKSDLFDEALFEVAWVYVKNKEFDKALRALELLALADPTSQKMPEVKILEGNLRIRKAQGIADAGAGNAKEEYDRALEVFENTRDAFRGPREELERMMADDDDPSAFLAQITGRHAEAFEVESTQPQAALPEVAAAWLRKEPEVERVVEIETDLGQIESEITDAENTIRRLDAALSSSSRFNLFPSLAAKRIRSTEILEQMFALRSELATIERGIVTKYASPAEKAEIARLQEQRQAVRQKLAALPDADLDESERVGEAQNRFTELEHRAAEVSTVIETSEAQLVALEKYVRDQGIDVDAPEMDDVRRTMEELRRDIDTMKSELASIRQDTTLARDQAGTGDEVAMRRRALRAELRQALDDEHRYLAQRIQTIGGADRTKADQVASLTRKANALTLQLDQLNGTIEAVVDEALAEVRGALGEEKAKLAAYKAEFAGYSDESRDLGGEVLGLSFGEVSKKFYQILIRSDVGVVDVAWSLKESADQAVKRLTLDQARERRTLDAEFADVIRQIRQEREQVQRESSGDNQ